MKIGDISTMGCVQCQLEFSVSMPHDTISVPSCPRCGTVVDGFEDTADLKERVSGASKACNHIKDRLRDIIQEIESTQNDIPPGTSLKALGIANQRLEEVNQFASEEAEELIDPEDF